MAGFKFRLEQVLNYRNQLEDQAKMAFSAAQASLAEQIQKLEELSNELVKQQMQLYKDVHEFWLRHNYMRSLKHDIMEGELAKQRLELLVERRRNELVKASQGRQLLEKLKENQAERYAHEQKLKEQHNLDEIASIRHQAAAI